MQVTPPTRPAGRLLAIDFGERRVGLALSDPEGRFAFPYRTLERSSIIAGHLSRLAARNRATAPALNPAHPGLSTAPAARGRPDDTGGPME